MAGIDTSSTALTEAEASCEYCPGAHAPRVDCPVVKENLASFHEEYDLMFENLKKEDQELFHETHIATEKIWEKYYEDRQDKCHALKKIYIAQEKYLRDSMKLYAKLRALIQRDEIKPMEGDDEEETQECIFCSSFHSARDCSIFKNKKEELLLIRDAKISEWENEFNAELRRLVDDSPEIWDALKTKYADKFRKMYLSLREQENRIINNLTIQ